MQSVSARIWTHVAVSISYVDNHYTTGIPLSLCLSLSLYIYIYIYIYVCVCVCVCVCVSACVGLSRKMQIEENI